MNIVYSSNDNYARHLAASMTSLLDNNREAPEICIWILNVGLSEENIRKLSQCAERFGRAIRIVDFSDIRARFPAEKIPTLTFSIETYARLFLAELLPESVHRAMWVDCDTVILGDIREMYGCDMHGKLAASVVDQPNFGLELSRRDADIPGGIYFCAGVFVADLDLWRQEKLSEQFLAYFAERNGNMMFLDQAIMNHVLHGRVHKLPFRCQVITPSLFLSYGQMCKRWGEPFYTKAEYVQGKRRPLVVHYTVFRPWKRWCLHPMKRYYRKYVKQTPYKDVPLEKTPLLPIVKKVCVMVLRRLHLIRN